MPMLRASALALLSLSLASGCVAYTGPGPYGPPPGGGPPVVVPPAVTVAPTLVVVPGTPVYYASNWPEELFFFEGRWYRPYQGRWFWSLTVTGGWSQISIGQVPTAVVAARPYYGRVPGHSKGRWKKHGHDDEEDDD